MKIILFLSMSNLSVKYLFLEIAYWCWDDCSDKGSWNVLILYRHCPNSFRPPPLSNRQTWKKIAPNYPGKPLHPKVNMGRKVPPTILASLYSPTPPLRTMPIYGNNTFQKGASPSYGSRDPRVKSKLLGSIPLWLGKKCVHYFHLRPVFDQFLRESLSHAQHAPDTEKS